MNEETEIDGLLRRSLAGPMPSLPAEFSQRLSAEVNRRSERGERFNRFVLAGYGVTSVIACVVMMRGQGMEWGPLIGAILAPLVLVAAVRIPNVVRR